MLDLIYTDDSAHNWFFDKYFFCGTNPRYWTFQVALNLLYQRKSKPVIVETGCQRMIEDIGAGMSTSIFGEYCQRYGGVLYTVDNSEQHLSICKTITLPYSNCIQYILSDSVSWLNQEKLTADLLYLDSLDFPIKIQTPEDLILKEKAQRHCLNEFLAALRSGLINRETVILADDNRLPSGGKPAKLKEYLAENGWICLLDFKQTLWISYI